METKHKYRVAIINDLTPDNPRSWDNVGTMVCWHGRYDLGDEQPSCDPEEHILALVLENSLDPTGLLDWLSSEYRDVLSVAMEDVRDSIRAIIADIRKGYFSQDRFFRDDWPMYREAVAVFNEHDSIAEYVRALFEEHYVVLPLYLYDHGGITMNCGGFSCPWDSGQVGYIYVSRDKAREEWGVSPKPDEMTDEEFWERRLRQEVETYSQYLEGDVYGYVLEKARGYTQLTLFEDGEVEEGEGLEWEHVDSCWGFFGYDPTENGMSEHVADVVVQAMVRADVSYGNGEPSWEYFETEEEL